MIPLVPFLGLMHFRIHVFSSLFLVELGALMMVASTMVPPCTISPLALEAGFHISKDSLTNMVLLKKVPEFQQGRRIRNLFLVEINTHERPHGIDVINVIFNSNIRQIEPDLHEVYMKHRLNAFYETTTLSGRIEWQESSQSMRTTE